MKLKELVFLDIRNYSSISIHRDVITRYEYKYTYGIVATSFFRKKYFKLVFVSKFPHFLWAEIQKMMLDQGIYFEDLEKGRMKHIKIGSLWYQDLTQQDIKKFSALPKIWKIWWLKRAVEKQKEFEKTYNKEYGRPDFQNFGLYD